MLIEGDKIYNWMLHPSFALFEQYLEESNNNYEFIIDIIKKIAKENNIDTEGDFIYLYHGTNLKNYNAILKSNKFKAGTWFSEKQEVAERFARQSTNGKIAVMHVKLYMGSLYYNGYFTTQEELHLIKNNEYVPKGYKYPLIENNNNETNIIDNIKLFLATETLIDDEFKELYNNDINKAWENFVDNQEMGDCQGIVANIIRQFPQVKKVFGEINIADENDEPEYFTHHWIEINGIPYDFSKGTLSNYIDWDNLYDVEIYNEEWRYNGF